MRENITDDLLIFDKREALGLLADYASKSCIYPIILILLIFQEGAENLIKSHAVCISGRKQYFRQKPRSVTFSSFVSDVFPMVVALVCNGEHRPVTGAIPIGIYAIEV